VLSTHNRGGTAGFTTGLSPLAYLCTQFVAIVRYLRLGVWPDRLTFDYGDVTIRSTTNLLPYAAVIVLLGIATLVALWRWPKIGILGAWFFAILAPTSSIVPVATQTIAEHRTYLPLAAIVTSVALAGYFIGRQLVGRGILAPQVARVVGSALAAAVCLAFGLVTWQRNFDYRSPLTIWRDTAAKVPYSSRAHNNYGLALSNAEQYAEAEAEYRRAIAIESDRPKYYVNLGNALFYQKKVDDAVAQYEKAIELESDVADYHTNLGNALLSSGRAKEAVPAYRKALELDDSRAASFSNLGNALASSDQIDEAAPLYEKALSLDPNDHLVHDKLGMILARRGKMDEAIAHFRKTVDICPTSVDGNWDLAGVLIECGRLDEAIPYLEKLMEINRQDAQARDAIRWVRAQKEQLQGDLSRRRELIRSRPKDIALLNNTAWILATNPNVSIRNGAEAVTLAQQAVALTGGQEPNVLGTLAVALAETGKFSEAIQTTEKAIELAKQQNKAALAESLQAKLPLYKNNLPFREPPSPAPQATQPVKQ